MCISILLTQKKLLIVKKFNEMVDLEFAYIQGNLSSSLFE